MLISLGLFLIFIVFSAFFSASETALFSLSSLKLRRLQDASRRGHTVKALLKRPTHLLSTIVFGNMLVNIALSSLSTAVFVSRWGESGLALAIVLSGTLILFFGEVFPKNIAIYAADKLSLFSAAPLVVFSRIFAPFIVLIESVVAFFSSFVIRRGQVKVLSEEELKAALLLGRKDGQITKSEQRMISHLLEFKDTWASEILTARIDIKGIDIKFNQAEVFEFLRRHKHSRFPVYEESLDNIVGVLHAKKVFLNPAKDWRLFLQEPIFVPESKRIDDLLKLFLEKHQRIAVVLDEYGGTEGMVTLEDIEEEIFGEIYDEFETPGEVIMKVEDGAWRIYGKTPLKTVNLELGLDLPEEENNLAGFLLSQMEKIPRSGESFKWQGLRFVIERATAKRITSVILRQEK